MSLKKILADDLKTAMKTKDKVKKSVVVMLRAAIKQIEVDERRDLADEDIVEIIVKQIKQKNNAIEDFRNGGREDLVELTQTEIDMLMVYLPAQLSEEEISDIVNRVIESTGAKSIKDMGKVMAIVSSETKGRADGKVIANMVKKSLNQ